MTATLFKVSDGRLDDKDVQTLAQAAKACKIIAFPTDTVYGLGSTGLVKAASRRIYQIKGRSNLKPLPVLIHSTEAAKRWAQWTPLAEILAQKFWPGPLTLVLRHTADGRLLTFPEYQTVALRVPNHDLLRRLIEASGAPWASTSANISGQPALCEASEVESAFKGLVDFIIDGGKAPGIESTIVDASEDKPRILRQGAISKAQIDEALGAAK
jgi:L-threonylcarbamoyladenylate synthase